MKLIARDVELLVNGVDLSNHVQKISAPEKWPNLDVTGMGAKFVERLLGIGDFSVPVTFFQDYDLGSVWATHDPPSVRVNRNTQSNASTNAGEVDPGGTCLDKVLSAFITSLPTSSPTPSMGMALSSILTAQCTLASAAACSPLFAIGNEAPPVGPIEG
jgi:hypothetical protein